jgi:hypothetical protein
MNRRDLAGHVRDLQREYKSIPDRGLDFDEWLVSQTMELNQQNIINDNIIKQYEIRVQQDIKELDTLRGNYATSLKSSNEMIEGLKCDVLEYKKLYEEYKQRYEYYKAEFDFAAKACATQTEKLELAQQVIKSIAKEDSFLMIQTIAENYFHDQSPEFEKNENT